MSNSVSPNNEDTATEPASGWLGWLEWCGGRSTAQLALLIGLAITLAKFPLLFTTLGEQDHGRLIMDAFIYVNDGPTTLRNYGIFTSPLWTLPLAGFMVLFGAAHVVILTNVGGWLCGGVTTALAFVLLRQMGAARAWAAAGSVAAGFLPGTFYISLYGYPSQFALPFIIASAVAYGRALDTGRIVWLVVSCVLYCCVALMKIDFALAGSLLFAVAIVKKRTFDRTWLLPLFPLIAIGVSFLVGIAAIDGQNLIQFLTHVDATHPWSAEELVDSHVSTIFYAIGLGTLIVLGISVIVGFIRVDSRRTTLRIVIAWLIGGAPLILFWLARPPMSTRHAMPGAFMTALFAALLMSQIRFRIRYAALLWIVAVVALNWPFGKPDYDFNYQPSGNLAGGLSMNRRAYAVVHEIARQIADPQQPSKAIMGHPQTNILGGIDFVPGVLVEMASRAESAKAFSMHWAGAIFFRRKDGVQTRTFIYVYPHSVTNLIRMRRVGYYTPYEINLKPLTRHDVKIKVFDANKMFEEASGEYIWR